MVNVNDIKSKAPQVPDKLQAIFEGQQELINKYLDIEKRNGLCFIDRYPVNIDDPQGQFRAKDFAWRITEEIGEALECLTIKPWASGEHQRPLDVAHFEEELVDANHFFVEELILCGFTPESLLGSRRLDISEPGDKLERLFAHCGISPVSYYGADGQDTIRLLAWYTVEELTKAMGCLKNRPWKSTHMQTDVYKFNQCLTRSYSMFIKLLSACGFNADSLWLRYYQKHEVNRFRQESNY